jgi:hypothetical protein
MEGRFTRLFPDAPAAKFSDEDLQLLADAMTADAEDAPTPEDEVDPEENSGIVAAYTYLGQFIDHDLTLDPTSHLREFVQDVSTLVDFRTPRFDLDCLYGRGPDDQPYLYDTRDGRVRMQLGDPMSGNEHDPGAVGVPRGPNGRALIGDPRNDENRIVSQLQATMLRFHNRMVDAMDGADFDEIRQQVRWHYQWVVVNDFLPTIVNAATIQDVFPHLAHHTSIAADPPRLSIPYLEHGLDLMPVEFSVAAYRFGHSMIRPNYRLNETLSRRAIFSSSTDPAGDLGGFRPVPSDWAIDWQFFVDLEHGHTIDPVVPDPNDPILGPGGQVRRPQHAYKIDTSLVNPLAHLPAVVATNPSVLALRNLLRGQAFELPSGQAVAEAINETPLRDDQILIGKATADPNDSKRPLVEIADGFAGNAPLWTYVLSEAHVTSWAAEPDAPNVDDIPIRLGPVGGRLVAEVFAALLLGDPTSYVSANPSFTPRPEFSHDGTFGLAELINVVLGRTP